MMLMFISAALSAAGTEAAAAETAAVNPFGGFMSWFFIAIGAFVIYSAITGKGQLYKNEYPQEIQEDVFKKTRLLAWVEGPLMLLQGVLDAGWFEVPQFISYIILGLGLAVVIAYIVWLYSKHGKVLKKMRDAQKKMPNF